LSRGDGVGWGRVALVDAAGRDMDEATPNAAAWGAVGARLLIGDSLLPLRVNAPTLQVSCALLATPVCWVTLRARWVTLRYRWVTLRARWVVLRARWVTLRYRWVTRRARRVTLRAR
jgi:hypothetical protein